MSDYAVEMLAGSSFHVENGTGRREVIEIQTPQLIERVLRVVEVDSSGGLELPDGPVVYFATGMINLALPTAAGKTHSVSVRNLNDDMVVTLTAFAGEIDGSDSFDLYPNESLTLHPLDGTWRAI